MKEEIAKGNVSPIAFYNPDGSNMLYTQKYVEEKDKEIERLNNIINELEKWYKKQYEDINKCLDYAREHHNLQEVEKYTRDHNMFAMCMEKLDKLKKLKEGK